MVLRVLIICALAVSSHFCKTVRSPRKKIDKRALTSTIERDSSWGFLRFNVDWSAVTANEKELYEKYIDPAFVYFSNALQVHQITSSSLWDEFYYNENDYCKSFFEKYTGKVIENTDMLVMITMEYNSDDGYIAYSTNCGYDPETDQPIATLLNFNKAYMEVTDNTVDELISTSIHELAHSLGFNYDDMGYFKKSDGSSYSNSELFTTLNIRGLTDQIFLSTPKVKELARKEFGCSDLPGVQLENQGGDGSLYQHWDKRMMATDYMMPDSMLSDIVYSDISLAVFEDSGWYNPDYSYATEINFGYGQGCDFIEEKCIVNEEAIAEEFCTDTETMFCDFSYLSYGYCGLYEDSEIPQEFQYFSDETIGGDYFNDYCPLNEGTYDCRSEFTATSDYGEKFGLNCRCVEGTFSKAGNTEYHASCHQITCNSDSFDVKIGSVTVTCNTDGEEISIKGYSGTMICPPFDRICADAPCRNMCYGGKCVNGLCENGGDADNFKGIDYPDYGNFSDYDTSDGDSSDESGSEAGFIMIYILHLIAGLY